MAEESKVVSDENLMLGMSQDEIIDFSVDLGINLLVAVIILFVGLNLAGILSRAVVKVLEKRESAIAPLRTTRHEGEDAAYATLRPTRTG